MKDPTGRLLGSLVRVACAVPTFTVALAWLLAAASVWYAVNNLGLATSTRALLPQGLSYVERFVEYDREFGELDDLVIVVEARSLPETTAYATRLVRELRMREVPLNRVAYRIDPKQFEGRALLYLGKDKLTEIRDRIFDYQEFMEAFASRPTLDRLIEGLATQVAGAFVTGFLDLGLGPTAGPSDFRFIEDLVTQVSTRIDKPAPYRSPWGALFSAEEDPSAGYFLSDDQRLLFILAEPATATGSFTGNRQAIEATRGVIASLRPQFPSVNVGVTGKPALSNDEMTTAFDDSQKATILAFALTLLLLLLGFRRLGKPILMLGVLAVSLAWSIGVVTVVIGHLSLFSVMFISIVIGIGIDYGIYFLFRYEEELFLGRGLAEALEITAVRSGPGMLLGAVTAAGSFYVLALTDFRGLQELGIVSGTAILLSWLAMMTVFPAALMVVDRRRASASLRSMPRALELERAGVPLLDVVAAHPRTVLALTVIVSVVSVWGLSGLRFDYNLLNLQAKGTESVTWEKRVLGAAHRSGFAALASADTLDEVRRKQAAFTRLGSVSEVDSVLLLIPEDQDEKRKIISDFAPLVAPVRVSRPLPLDLERLTRSLQTLRRRLGIAANEAPPGEAKERLGRLNTRLDELLRRLRQGDRETLEPALTHLQQQLYGDFLRNFQRLQANLAPRQVGLDDLPVEIRKKFVSDRGRFLLQIHPAVDIWDREGARRFVEELRTVDADITGTPIITFEAIRLMERACKQGTVYAIGLVALMTAITIRRWRETPLALLPLGLGLLWTFGLMSFLHLKVNLGNIFAIPLILGASTEFGTNIVMRFMEGKRDYEGPLVARSTVMAVLFNGLTTIVGFGSLMLAHHRGIFGLGLLLTLGMVASLVAALVVLPVLLRMVRQIRIARHLRRLALAVVRQAAASEEATARSENQRVR
ncbi:MAG TPA: MMPL family transporter [Methylomirabilota bacterium]|nr:MMPL family transporter [Methylomirabilota bacterium]